MMDRQNGRRLLAFLGAAFGHPFYLLATFVTLQHHNLLGPLGEAPGRDLMLLAGALVGIGGLRLGLHVGLARFLCRPEGATAYTDAFLTNHQAAFPTAFLPPLMVGVGGMEGWEIGFVLLLLVPWGAIAGFWIFTENMGAVFNGLEPAAEESESQDSSAKIP